MKTPISFILLFVIATYSFGQVTLTDYYYATPQFAEKTDNNHILIAGSAIISEDNFYRRGLNLILIDSNLNILNQKTAFADDGFGNIVSLNKISTGFLFKGLFYENLNDGTRLYKFGTIDPLNLELDFFYEKELLNGQYMESRFAFTTSLRNDTLIHFSHVLDGIDPTKSYQNITISHEKEIIKDEPMVGGFYSRTMLNSSQQITCLERDGTRLFFDKKSLSLIPKFFRSLEVMSGTNPIRNPFEPNDRYFYTASGWRDIDSNNTIAPGWVGRNQDPFLFKLDSNYRVLKKYFFEDKDYFHEGRGDFPMSTKQLAFINSETIILALHALRDEDFAPPPNQNVDFDTKLTVIVTDTTGQLHCKVDLFDGDNKNHFPSHVIPISDQQSIIINSVFEKGETETDWCDIEVMKINHDCEILGIHNLKSKTISFFPNPAQDEIHISGMDSEPIDGSVYDQSGRVVMEIKNKNKLDISQLPIGLYHIVGTQNSGPIQGKFIKK